jgi:uncharacterized membrane protein
MEGFFLLVFYFIVSDHLSKYLLKWKAGTNACVTLKYVPATMFHGE